MPDAPRVEFTFGSDKWHPWPGTATEVELLMASLPSNAAVAPANSRGAGFTHGERALAAAATARLLGCRYQSAVEARHAADALKRKREAQVVLTGFARKAFGAGNFLTVVRMDGTMGTDGPLGVDGIVERLRLIRTVSQQRRYPGRQIPRLPSKLEIIQILHDTVGVLYPRHFGPAGLTADQTDSHVQRMLGSVRQRLQQQILFEWLLGEDGDPGELALRATEAAQSFIESLVRVRDLHDTDILAAYAGDPSAKSLDEIVFCFPGVDAVLRHRVAHELYKLGATMTARIMSEYSHSVTGIDIHPGAKAGPAFFIDHGTGVVIGETAIIGRNVRLYQQVTLGAKRFETDENGNLIKGMPRHPVLEDDVVIYAGATILGRVTIGRGSVIGGGVWLTEGTAPGSVVTQAKPHLSIQSLGAT